MKISKKSDKKEKKEEYVSPEVLTFDEDEMLKELGPAHACSPVPPCGIYTPP